MSHEATYARYFREPIPEIFDSVRYLDAAVSAHLCGHRAIAEELFVLANDPKVWAWTDSVWGKKSPYVKINKLPQLHTSFKAASVGWADLIGPRTTQ